MEDAADLVSFEFQDEELLEANKFVLAAHSTVFKRQFFGPLKEQSVRVKDFSREAFEQFLELLVKKRCEKEVSESCLVELWALADKYCALDVKSIVEQRLLRSENLEEGLGKAFESHLRGD